MRLAGMQRSTEDLLDDEGATGSLEAALAMMS